MHQSDFTMSLVRFSILATWSVICVTAARADHVVHLRGLINLTEWQGALLEVNHSLARSNQPPAIFTTTRLVKSGEQFEDKTIKGAHVSFEILQINMEGPGGEHIRLRENGKDTAYGFESIDAVALSTRLGIELQKARFQDVVDLYARLKCRTVLLHPRVIWSPVSVRAGAQNEKEATAALETVFRDRGIAPVNDGDKFALLVPTSMENTIKPVTKEMESASPQFGSIYLDSPLDTVIEYYGRMLGRERIQGDQSPSPGKQVYLRTGVLSKAEAQHAFERLLEWNGIKVVLVDDKTFKVVRLPDASSP